MGIINKYPYTDMHEMNLDWILDTVKKLDADLAGIEERATEAAIAGAKAYVDEELVSVIERFNELQRQVDILNNNFNTTVSQLQTQYRNFINQVNAQITIMSGRIDAIRAEINADIIGVNARTDLAIEQNNQYIFEQIEERISDQIRVRNYFTGERMTIQQMFDYLAELHVTDGITYAELATRSKTYAEIAALNITYTNLTLHGNTLIV